MRCSSTGDIACSSRSASSCTSSQGMPSTSVRKRSIRRWRLTTPAAKSRPFEVNSSDLSALRVMYPSPSSRPTISCTVGAETCIARATFAAVIGSWASSSQKIVCRYSSSATVAFATRSHSSRSPTHRNLRSVSLPLKPPIQPQLARPAKELPSGEEWRFEPKWDGFRTIVFRDGDEIYLQSRNGKPMNRYFPEVVEAVRKMERDRLVMDGEIVVVVDGVQEFDLLGQRIHPAESRVRMLAEQWPAAYVAFDLLAEGDEVLMELPYRERRERLLAAVGKPIEVTPATDDHDAAGQWLTGVSEGVVAKQAGAAYKPGERVGMCKIKRVRTADLVVFAFRFGKAEGTLRSLILGAYDDEGELRVVGHTSGFKAKEKREFIDKLEPYRTHERGSGEPSRWKSDEELVWEGLRPELVVEVGFDHITGNRIRHGAKFRGFREDKEPHECTMDQLRA